MAQAAAGRSNLALRLLTAAVWVPFLLYLLYLAPPWCFPLVAGIVGALGAWELFTLLAPDHWLLRVWGLVASSAVFGAIARGASFVVTPVLVGVTTLGMLVALRAPAPIERAALRTGWAIAGPFYVGGLFGVIADLFRRDHGGSWVMLSLLCGFLSDTGGYFVGRRYGKRPLARTISPKKTIEGAIGGLACGLIGGLLAHFWFLPVLPLPNAIALALAATALGQAGDLCESMIKRGVGVKDSGTLLPGHGGILDRSDAMLFSAATIWAYAVLFG